MIKKIIIGVIFTMLCAEFVSAQSISVITDPVLIEQKLKSNVDEGKDSNENIFRKYTLTFDISNFNKVQDLTLEDFGFFENVLSFLLNSEDNSLFIYTNKSIESEFMENLEILLNSKNLIVETFSSLTYIE